MCVKNEEVGFIYAGGEIMEQKSSTHLTNNSKEDIDSTKLSLVCY